MYYFILWQADNLRLPCGKFLQKARNHPKLWYTSVFCSYDNPENMKCGLPTFPILPVKCENQEFLPIPYMECPIFLLIQSTMPRTIFAYLSFSKLHYWEISLIETPVHLRMCFEYDQLILLLALFERYSIQNTYRLFPAAFLGTDI